MVGHGTGAQNALIVAVRVAAVEEGGGRWTRMTKMKRLPWQWPQTTEATTVTHHASVHDGVDLVHLVAV